MLLDALCHPGSAADPAAFLDEAAGSGVGHLVLGGYSPETWARDQCLSHPSVALHRTVGLHPWIAAGADLAPLRAAVRAGGVVALGEIGLDRARGRGRDTYPQQQAAFSAQLQLARAHDLPVLLHVVRSHGHAQQLLAAHPPPGGVVHGFSGAAEVALGYVRLGLHVSFGAMLLNPHARKVRAAAQQVPLARLLIETDAPDQLPGPAHLARVLDALAALRPEPRAALAEATLENGRRVYRL